MKVFFSALTLALPLTDRPLSGASPRNVDSGAMHDGERLIFEWPSPTGELGNQ
jgi:hypothetical protein